LRYQSQRGSPVAPAPAPPGRRGEWLTIKVRYQEPAGAVSRLISVPVATTPTARPQFVPFAAAVAEFGLLLRDGRGSTARWDDLITRLQSIPVPTALRADRDHVEELATAARGLVRLR
jgi:Ca-activated chloride channel family protein